MRRALLTILVVLLAATGVFATGGSEPDPEAPTIRPMDASSLDPMLRNGLLEIPDVPTEIEFYTSWSGDSFALIEQFIDEIVGVLYPNITVEAQSGESADMVQVINTRLAAGSPPDIVMAASSYFMKDWAESGALYDMSAVWDEFNLEDVIPQGVAGSMNFGGNYYGLPFVVELSNVLYWNENVLAEGGAAAPPYDTWDDFWAAAESFDAEGKSFWGGGYSPDWFGMAKSLMIGASYFGPEYYERIMNGTATAEDFRRTLELQARIFEYANEDYVSASSTTGGAESTGAGLTGMCLLGPWGHPRMVQNELEFGTDWNLGVLPGTPTFVYYPTTFMVFDASDDPLAAAAMCLTGLLLDTQSIISPSKGAVPARTDVDTSVFPRIGRVEVSDFSNRLIADAVSVPRARVGLPSVVASEYPAPFGSFIAGSSTLEEAVEDLMEIQARHQDAFTIEWDF